MVPINLNGRVVGEVRGTVFYRTLHPNHILRKPPSIALHVEVLKRISAAGATMVEFALGDTIYRAPLTLYWERGIPIDRGWGEQRALLLTDFYTISVNGRVAACEHVDGFGGGS